jgi:hypothetical protein
MDLARLEQVEIRTPDPLAWRESHTMPLRLDCRAVVSEGGLMREPRVGAWVREWRLEKCGGCG